MTVAAAPPVGGDRERRPEPPEATYGFAAADGPRLEHVALDAIGPDVWRMTDDRLPAHDPFRLLGIIGQREGRFELLLLGSGVERTAFDTLGEALATVVATATAVSRRRLRAGAIDEPWSCAVCRTSAARA